MKKIFEHGEFSYYRSYRLDEARKAITESYDSIYHSAYKKTTVFISHKHDDLDDLRDVLGFLETVYGVKVYIDSQDPSMPKKTSGETAKRIKERIEKCNKFILLATNGAIESKWCNWELGYGDAKKYKRNMALFPIKDKGESDYLYNGNEYMSIYPYITYFNGTEKYTSGKLIEKGYYIREEQESGPATITPLSEWLQR